VPTLVQNDFYQLLNVLFLRLLRSFNFYFKPFLFFKKKRYILLVVGKYELLFQ